MQQVYYGSDFFFSFDCYRRNSFLKVSENSGGSKGSMKDAPRGVKFFQFYAVLGKFWQNGMLAPPGGLVSPPLGNPGSSTAK